MATRAGVGRSTLIDSREAGHEAARRACDALGEARPSLCVVFATAAYDQPALISAVRECCGEAALAGCTGEGVIAGSSSDEGEHVVGVLAVHSDTLGFETFLVQGYGEDSVAAGRTLAQRVTAVSRGDEIALLVFPDGLAGNCTALLSTLAAALPPAVRIVGGAAGDAMAFERTWQYGGGEVASGSLSAVLIRGPGRIEIAVSHGCSAIGLERRVTSADASWLREIDGRPAWSVFKEYLDGDPQDLNVEGITHLCIGEELPATAAGEYEPYIIHTPMNLDPATGALFFAGGGLRENMPIRLTRRDEHRITESARTCAARVSARHPGHAPVLVLQFDCAGRGNVMFGPRVAEHVVHPLQESLGKTTPWLGFHTFGEIAPVAGRTYYHNYSVAVCALYDEP